MFVLLFERGYAPSDPHRLLKLFFRSGSRGVRCTDRGNLGPVGETVSVVFRKSSDSRRDLETFFSRVNFFSKQRNRVNFFLYFSPSLSFLVLRFQSWVLVLIVSLGSPSWSPVLVPYLASLSQFSLGSQGTPRAQGDKLFPGIRNKTGVVPVQLVG